ncbi:S-layer homology domain-containing protein [Paenibacillus chungangensis]|uniref:S-layer homology domain-containing protein n=1 Tax=Paenibacillus chungangensis TaxID=696535 RepID=A0ABW3HW69_9BACL
MYKQKFMRIWIVFTVAIILIPLLSMQVQAQKTQTFNDTSSHWAQIEIDKWSGLGIIKGYDGEFRPNDNIKRAEIAVIVNRLMEYQETDESSFHDVKELSYYYDAILKMHAAGIMLGYEGYIRPDDFVTREEAAVILARVLNMEEATKPSTVFTDDASISTWAKGYIKQMQDKGYVLGRNDGMFQPKRNITRAEFVKMLNNTVEKLFNNAGTYEGTVQGNVVVNTSDVTLKDMTVEGDLILAEGIAEGDVTLDNVDIQGELTIKGGGTESIYLKNGTKGKKIILAKAGNGIRIHDLCSSIQNQVIR